MRTIELHPSARLIDALRAAWNQETSSLPLEWTYENPSRGQCAVSALVLQDYLGGTLFRGLVNGESHYWLELPSGVRLDTTLDQFGATQPPHGEPRERDYVLSFHDTRRRYELVRFRVDDALSRA